MTGHTTRRPFTFSTYLKQILPSLVRSSLSHRTATTSIPVDSSRMAPKVLPLPKEDTIQAVQDFVNKAVPSVNIDMESPALPHESPQSRLAITRDASSADPGPSTRRPHNSLSLTAFPDLIQHFKDSILPTLHYATRLLTFSRNPSTESSKPPRLRRQSTSRSERALDKSSSAQPNDQNYEWRQGETTDEYCLFDLSASGKGVATSESQPPVVLMVLSPWKYSARDLEDMLSERQTKKSSSRSSSKRSKIVPILTKLATHSQQVQSRHVIVSTYEYWSFGRFEPNSSGSTEHGTFRLTSAMSHDSGEPGMITSQAGSSHPDHHWPVTVLQASLYWIRQALESSKPIPPSPRKTRTSASPRKRLRDEADGDTEDEAEVYNSLQASYSSFSSIDQASPSKRPKPSRLSFADLPSIQEEEASLRRSSRRRSAVQSSMGSSSSATAVAEKPVSKPTGTRRKAKKSAASTRTDSSDRDASTRTPNTARSKATATEKPVPLPRPSTSTRESKPLPKVSAPSPRRSRKHAREDDLTDIDDQPSPSKKARIRPAPLTLSAPKSPTRRPKNEATAVASPIYVSSSPPTTTRVTRSSSLLKNSSRTLYLERIYAPGTGIALAESDRWSNQGNLSDRNHDWLHSKDDSYQTVVESDDREEFYGDVPSPAAMAKLREGSEEYDSGYGRSTSPYVPDEGALKHLAGRTDHITDPKSMGSLLKKGSKKTSVA